MSTTILQIQLPTLEEKLDTLEEKLDTLIALLQNVAARDCDNCVTSVAQCAAAAGVEAARQLNAPSNPTAPASATEAAPAETGHPVEETPAPATPEPAAEPVKVYTRDDIQAMVIKLASPNTGKKAKARAIVLEYAERVGLIPEDKFPEVMERLTALDKEG